MTVVDADAHVNEPIVQLVAGGPAPGRGTAPWLELERRHPGWLSPTTSGAATVSSVQGRAYPTQEGPGRGVPVDSALNPAIGAGAHDVAARLADLDAEGIDVQVLYGGLAIGVSSFPDAAFAADFARAYNDWLLDLAASTGGRLRAVAVLPVQDPARAVAELERAAGLGAVAAMVPPTPRLAGPELLPVLEAAASTGTAVGVHGAPGMHLPMPAGDCFDNYAQVHCVAFPVDQMVAFTALVMGGVLDRLPTLRVAFLESGVGWVPYYVARAHEHRTKRPAMLEAMRSDPAEYLQRGQCFFSFECDDPMLEPYVERLGAGSLVFSSDYPHWDCEFPGAVAEARRRAGFLGEDGLAGVLGDNAARLYGLA